MRITKRQFPMITAKERRELRSYLRRWARGRKLNMEERSRKEELWKRGTEND